MVGILRQNKYNPGQRNLRLFIRSVRNFTEKDCP
jgi:hypothetical protein